MPFDDYLDKLTQLRVGRIGSHERPHKPTLLLAIISMIEAGRMGENCIAYGPELFSRFRKFFHAVRTADDATNMLDPFWRLRADGLLEHQPNAGFEAAVTTQSAAPTVRQLQEMCSHSSLPTALYDLLQDLESRERLRRTIIQRYFADQADQLDQIIREERGISDYERILEELPTAPSPPSAQPEDTIRDQAFRRVVLRAYDYRCAACGLRVVVDDFVLVDAAHLVPFAVSRDDDPRNGITLCKNHHWAMDRDLIAPTTELAWRVSRYLDDRIEGQRDLVDLDGRSVILPRSSRFHPKPESLQWREHRLRTA